MKGPMYKGTPIGYSIDRPRRSSDWVGREDRTRGHQSHEGFVDNQYNHPISQSHHVNDFHSDVYQGQMAITDGVIMLGRHFTGDMNSISPFNERDHIQLLNFWPRTYESTGVDSPTPSTHSSPAVVFRKGGEWEEPQWMSHMSTIQPSMTRKLFFLIASSSNFGKLFLPTDESIWAVQYED